MKMIIVVLVLLLLVGCSIPAKMTDAKMTGYDKDTRYVVEDSKDGFIVTIEYSKYQFIPETEALIASCKSQLTSIAWEYADKAGRKIENINEQRIKISTGRSPLSGVSFCSAQAVAQWLDRGGANDRN